MDGIILGAPAGFLTGISGAETIAGQMLVETSPLSRKHESGQWQRLPMFPGCDHKDTVKRIVELMGHPDDSTLNALSLWEPKAAEYVKVQPYARCDIDSKSEMLGIMNPPEGGILCSVDAEKSGCEWGAIFPGADPDLLSLLDGCMQWDPEKRLTASQALMHPYFRSGHVSFSPFPPSLPVALDVGSGQVFVPFSAQIRSHERQPIHQTATVALQGEWRPGARNLGRTH